MFFFFILGATTITSSATTVFNLSSTSKNSLSWPSIILFGTFGFMLFVGLLTWLCGKIYVALYGLPQLPVDTEPAHDPGCECGTCCQRRFDANMRNIDEGWEELSRLYAHDEELQRTFQSYLEREPATEEHEPPTVTNHLSPRHLPFYRRFISTDKQITNPDPSRSYLQREPATEEHEPPAVMNHHRPRHLSFYGGFNSADKLISNPDPPRSHFSRVQARVSSAYKNINKKDQQEEIYSQCDSPRAPGEESPSVRHRPRISISSGLMNFYYLGRMPFLGVANLSYELQSESDVVRKYYMGLLPFSGVINWEEVLMASWEIARLLFSALPFCDVSNEVLRECACSLVPKRSGEKRGCCRYFEMFDDIEAAVSSPKDSFSMGEMTDFVHYEDEVEKKATTPVKITCRD